MGFIDYNGTKEDRYSEVLEFAKAQQKEEIRQHEDELAVKAVEKLTGSLVHIPSDTRDLIRHIIVKYRALLEQMNLMDDEETNDPECDSNVLWNDLCIALLSQRLDEMDLPEERRNVYYNTFKDKVFKLNDAASATEHYAKFANMKSYRRYFYDCYDLTGEKQFWKWLGWKGNGNRERPVCFAENYEQLSVLIGYYLFREIHPTGKRWMQRLEIEHKVIERLRNEYEQGRFAEPDFAKLGNQTGALRRTRLDIDEFEKLLKQKKLTAYVEAIRLLRKCGLPERMDELYGNLIERIPILREAIGKFADVYQPDMYQFYEYYIPEALQLTASYIEYLDAGIGEKILSETETEVLDAAKKLLTAVNDKVDEIYKYASIEIKARSKALESMMSQDGYIDEEFKINSNGGKQ